MPTIKTITEQELNRATLARQMLVQREPLDVAEALRRILAVQAQTPASPYIALWNRIIDFDSADLDAELASGAVVKSNAVRLTLHVSRVKDHRMLREATEPSLRAAKLGSKFKAAGYTVADAAVLVPKLLEFVAEPRTGAECESWLKRELGEPVNPGVWWGLRQYAPMLHMPTGGPWSFNDRPTYVAPASVPTLLDQEVADTALQAMILRYLAAFGPATIADVAQFGLVKRSRVKEAMAALDERLEGLQGPGGTFYDVPDGLRPPADRPAPPRLMAMWDNTLLAYNDRSRVIPPHLRSLVTRNNGDVLPTLLVDGYVAGVWRHVDGRIEARAFESVSDADWDALAIEAGMLASLLDRRDAGVYSRYGHWWDRLPHGEIRTLTAA